MTLNSQSTFVLQHGFCNDALAAALGLQQWVDRDISKFKSALVRKALREMHRKAELKAGATSLQNGCPRTWRS